MNKLNIVRNYMIDNDFKMVVMNNDKMVLTSKDRGIKPIYDAYTKNLELLNGSFVADRVIGKAAAELLIHGNIKGLYTDLISDIALGVLNDHEISVDFKNKVPYILNREGNDLCPIETISRNSKDINQLIQGIEEFFIKVGMVNK